MSFFSEYKQVNQLVKRKQQVVVYAESRHYFQYFEKLITDLLANSKLEICYITSDAGDPLLTNAPARIKPVYVKWMLGFLFSKIRADVMILTMPDLDNFLFKRSKGVGTYIYLFHAAVSTHQQYRKEAFFNYDTIFCTGPYQEEEIRLAEKLYAQKEKTVIPYGYPLFDSIGKRREEQSGTKNDRVILIAPSWFEGCIFDTCLEELLNRLENLPYKIILRLHPEYEKRKKKEFRRIQRLVAAKSNIMIDDLPNVTDRLSVSDILITDRSGIAFEFAFGTGKPVLFIETALKETNPDWRELDMPPIENSIRSKLGIVVLPNELDQLPRHLKELEDYTAEFPGRIKELREELFYNSEESYKKGWEYVISKSK
jgi:hypothetical protein